MGKFTLIQVPWTSASEGNYAAVYRAFTSFPPLGLMSLAASLEKAGHAVDLIDLEVEPQSFEDLCARIKNFSPGMIGLTATTPVYPVAASYARRLKERFGLPIVVGGAHVTALREEALSPDMDFAVFNEGEATLVELARELEGRRAYAGIKGLVWREGSSVRVNQPRPFLENLDSLPFPSRGKISPSRYSFEVPGLGVVPVFLAELSRGCPFNCVFCGEGVYNGRKLRSRSPARVVEDILDAKAKFGAAHFGLVASTLTADRGSIEGLCRELIRRKAGVTFEGQTRANLVDGPLLALLREAGLVRLNFGLESVDPNALLLMRKGVTPEEVRTALRLCRGLGISTTVASMLGNPGDTRETVMATARFVRATPEIRYSPFAIAVPYPGTELRRMAEQGLHGLKLLSAGTGGFSRYAGGMMEVNGMGPAELARLQRRAMLVAHASPSKILGLLRHFGAGSLLRAATRALLGGLGRLCSAKEPAPARPDAKSKMIQ